MNRFHLLITTFALVLAGLVLGEAQISVPYTFTSGTTITSSQVNSNFSTFGTSALNRTAGTMTGTLTAQQITPGTDATYDIGTSSFKFRDFFFSRNGLVGGTLGVTGATSLNGAVALGDAAADAITVPGTIGSNLIFTDATYDIGASGATRPRDAFLSRDVTFGRNLVGPGEFDNGNSGSTITISFAAQGAIQKVTRTASCTYTLTAPSAAATMVLKMVHTSGNSTAFTVTFSPVPKWPSGTAPTFTNSASAVDIVTLYWDGTSWYGTATADLR